MCRRNEKAEQKLKKKKRVQVLFLCAMAMDTGKDRKKLNCKVQKQPIKMLLNGTHCTLNTKQPESQATTHQLK